MPQTKNFPPEILAIIQTYVWWKPPNEALQFPHHVLAQTMNWGTWEDTMKMIDAFGRGAFIEALKNAPPGVIGHKSWVFWHCWFELEIPPMPTRILK